MVFQRSGVIALGFGQCGVQAMSSFWELQLQEHGLDVQGCLTETGRNNFVHCQIHEVFDEYIDGHFIPRCIFIDSDPTPIEEIQRKQLKNLFRDKNFASSKEGAGNLFPRGKNNYPELIEESVNHYRYWQERENAKPITNSLEFYSTVGGTGSGLSVALDEVLQNGYAKKKRRIIDFVVYPSKTVGTNTVSPYNTILNLNHHLNKKTNALRVVFQNDALQTISGMHMKSPTYANLNSLISQTATSVSSYPFSGELNCLCHEMFTNLIPFPHMNHVIPGFYMGSGDVNGDELVRKMFHSPYGNFASATECSDGIYISTCIQFRGDSNVSVMNAAIQKLMSDTDLKFVSWSPRQFKLMNCTKLPIMNYNDIFCYQPVDSYSDNEASFGFGRLNPYKLEHSIARLANTTSIYENLELIGKKFDSLYHWRAFLLWYTNQGCTDEDFLAARNQLSVVVDDYKTIHFGSNLAGEEGPVVNKIDENEPDKDEKPVAKKTKKKTEKQTTN